MKDDIHEEDELTLAEIFLKTGFDLTLGDKVYPIKDNIQNFQGKYKLINNEWVYQGNPDNHQP